MLSTRSRTDYTIGATLNFKAMSVDIFNSLLNHKILDFTKLQAFADDKT